MKKKKKRKKSNESSLKIQVKLNKILKQQSNDRKTIGSLLAFWNKNYFKNPKRIYKELKRKNFNNVSGVILRTTVLD